MNGFYEMSLVIDEAKKKPAPTANVDIDRWVKAVEELAKDLEDYKKVKSNTDKKLRELKAKKKKAIERLEKEKSELARRRGRVKEDLLRAKESKESKESKSKDERPQSKSAEQSKDEKPQPKSAKQIKDKARLAQKNPKRRPYN